jgi:serine protease AprX
MHLRVLVLALAAGLAGAITAGAAERTPALQAALAERPDGVEIVWVYFRDKGPDPAARLESAQAELSPRALSRRAIRGDVRTVTLDDVPVSAAYVDAVRARVTRVRHEVRWVNAVSVEATAPQVNALAALPFVDRLDVVRRYRRLPAGDRGREVEDPSASASTATAPDDLPWKRRLGAPSSGALDYGLADNQVRQINVPAVHALGLHGEGVVVAMFDTGFNTLSHQSLAQAQIAATRDFVNGDPDVGDGGRGNGSHGTQTLSVIGGFQSGRLIGPAFAATFLLAKTEDTTSETPVEEDNWAAATEWAEARGADVISSSLGYLTFDAPHRSYTPADMNGQTAISTRAADAAAARGVVVVNSAGNSGFSSSANTLGAPADGRLVIAVGAVDAAGNRASFSSVGPSADGRVKPDVAAQGVSVLAAVPGTGSAYAPVNGTSFSCPLTAGVVALMLQARPSATVQQVEDALRRTASRANNPDNLTGHGIVNALAAVQAITR